MKKYPSFALLTLFLLSNNLFSQPTFSVSPGISLNSSNFGYSINQRIQPYVGFHYLTTEIAYSSTYEEYDWDFDRVLEVNEEETVNGRLFIPNIGIKYHFYLEEDFKSFINLSVSKPILDIRYESDGEVDEDIEDITENLDILGGELSFGCDYFLSDKFSLGGEFGVRYLKATYKNEYNDLVYNYDTDRYEPSNVEENLEVFLSPTFTRISFTYHF